MISEREGDWGPWIRHMGGGMPVPHGTVVEVYTLIIPTDGVVQKIGIAGVDLIKSWNWTPKGRANFRSAPIDFYRVRKPRGLLVLEDILASVTEPKRNSVGKKELEEA
jgi:hypothetical protein